MATPSGDGPKSISSVTEPLAQTSHPSPSVPTSFLEPSSSPSTSLLASSSSSPVPSSAVPSSAKPSLAPTVSDEKRGQTSETPVPERAPECVRIELGSFPVGVNAPLRKGDLLHCPRCHRTIPYLAQPAKQPTDEKCIRTTGRAFHRVYHGKCRDCARYERKQEKSLRPKVQTSIVLGGIIIGFAVCMALFVTRSPNIGVPDKHHRASKFEPLSSYLSM
jgi:hypothetical protein